MSSVVNLILLFYEHDATRILQIGHVFFWNYPSARDRFDQRYAVRQ